MGELRGVVHPSWLMWVRCAGDACELAQTGEAHGVMHVGGVVRGRARGLVHVGWLIREAGGFVHMG